MAGGASSYSRNHGNVAESFATEHAPVAFDFERRAQRFGVVVRELNGGLAFHGRHPSDQAGWIKIAALRGIAATEIVCQQRSPTPAEKHATARGPPFFIFENPRPLNIAFPPGA